MHVFPVIEQQEHRGGVFLDSARPAVFLLFDDREDVQAARSTDDGRRYTKGPVKTWLKIGKNRYGEQGRCIALWHYKSETRFVMEGE